MHNFTSMSIYILVKYVQDIPTSVFNINKAQKALQRHSIWITDSDHEYILGGILRREQIDW